MRTVEKLCIGYVPGLDARRIGPHVTPFLSRALAEHPAVGIRTLPSTELVPTLLSGVLPHEHGVWQVSLRPQPGVASRLSPVDRLPDVVTTTAQCVRHLFDPGFDLAAIPPRRRRRFTLHRFKYTRRAEAPEVLARFGPHASLFGLLGERARYRFTKRFDTLDALLRTRPGDGLRLELIEMYALDLFQHWNLDRPEAMRDAYARADAFLGGLHARGRRHGFTLLVLVDHGQEPVVGTVPLVQTLRRSGIPEHEFTYFAEVGQARFWFHTARARLTLVPLLSGLPNVVVKTRREMHAYDVRFEDDAYGELYVLARPGFVFFPHDFHHPLANLFLGLSDRLQRRRIFRAVHRGNHAYLPEHPSERGYAVLFDDRFRAARPTLSLIDFAPTVLALLGLPQPPSMAGTAGFEPSRVASTV